MLEVLKKENKREFDADDEIWVLIDRDDWINEHIEELKGAHKSLKLKAKDFQVLISNPKFELWLLYHFKNAPKVGSVKKLDEALNKQWPGYDKAIPRGKFKREDVFRAADQAKRICAVREKSISLDPDVDMYYSEVYKLLERLGILN